MFLPLFWLGFTPIAFADALSLDDALKEARSQSPDLQASGATAEESDWGRTEALAAFLPHLNITADHYFKIKYQTLDIALLGPSINFPFITPSTIYSLNASWSLFNGFQDANLLSAAKMKSEASHRDLDWAKFQTEQSVRNAFYEVIASRQLESVADENVRNLEEHLKQVQNMMHAGEAIEVNVLRVQVQLNNARSQKINAHDQVIISQQKLAQVLGKASESRVPDGNLPIPDESVARKIEQARLDSRPDLEARDLQSTAAEKAAKAAENYWIPSLALVGNYQFYNNINNDVLNSQFFKSAYQYGVELKWNLFDGLLSHARAHEAAAEAIRQQKNEQSAKLKAATDVETFRSQYRYQMTQFQTNTENLERSRRSVQLALSGQRSGTQTNTDVLDAELDLFNARAGVIQSQLGAIEAQISFENAIGRKL